MARTETSRLTAEERWERRIARASRHDRAARRERDAARGQDEEVSNVVLTLHPRFRHVNGRLAA